MAKREQERSTEATKKVADEAKRIETERSATHTLQEIGQQQRLTTQQIQKSIHESLDETKNSISESIDEAASQIPQYTGAVKSYQEQALQSTKEMAFNYIEAQKSVMDSIFGSTMWIPYYENASRMYNYWFSTRIPTEIYARTVSNIADSISTSARIGNNITFGNIDLLTTTFERAQQSIKDLSRIQKNTTKVFEETAKSAVNA
jgi:hypothetical protein